MLLNSNVIFLCIKCNKFIYENSNGIELFNVYGKLKCFTFFETNGCDDLINLLETGILGLLNSSGFFTLHFEKRTINIFEGGCAFCGNLPVYSD